MDEPLQIRRSARRRRTISVFRDGGQLVAVIPASLPASFDKRQVEDLVASFLAKEAKRRPLASDEGLTSRANELAHRYLLPVLTDPLPTFGVRWSTTQHKRWGSCTPDTGQIRISTRLRALPEWVCDYVLVHELVHLVELHHTPRFHALVSVYPHAERAKGYLEGFSHGQGVPAWDE